MIHALGYSYGVFSTSEPGRLCRGRERWIESSGADEQAPVHRVVISGAAFEDDSARDARRGLSYSSLNPGQVLRALFPSAPLIARAEDAHPGRVPAGASGVEHYEVARPAGPLRRWGSRWSLNCADPAAIDRAIDAGADVFVVLGDGPLPDDAFRVPPAHAALPHAADAPDPIPDVLPESMLQRLFRLTGQRVQGPPARSFQAAAIPPLLEAVPAVVLVHKDKHAACLGVYTTDHFAVDQQLSGPLRAMGALCVPFAIPPMLARWDRALWELRQDWDEATYGAFPVPPAREGSVWSRRGSRPEE